MTIFTTFKSDSLFLLSTSHIRKKTNLITNFLKPHTLDHKINHRRRDLIKFKVINFTMNLSFFIFIGKIYSLGFRSHVYIYAFNFLVSKKNKGER
jgi:hypothetical protein